MTLRNSYDADKLLCARSAVDCAKKIKSHQDEAFIAKQHETIHNVINKAGTTFDDLWYIGKALGVFVKGIDPFIQAIPWLAGFATILSSLFRLGSTFLGKKNTESRVLTVSASVAAIGLGIAFLVVPVFTAAFIIATNIIDFFMSSWEFLHTTIDYRKEHKQQRDKVHALEKELINALDDPIKFALFKKYRTDRRANAANAAEYDSIRDIITLDKNLTKAGNEVRKTNGEYANAVQTYIVGTISRVAAILFFFFPPVGAALLLATGIYGVLDRFNLNPFKWVAKKVLGENNPFAERKHHFSVEKLERVKPRVAIALKLQEQLKPAAAIELQEKCLPAPVTKAGFFSKRKAMNEEPHQRLSMALSA